jgi:aconitate hydratase
MPTGSRWLRPIPKHRACSASPTSPDPVFTDTLELDLSTVVPSLAGPKRPQDRVALVEAAPKFAEAMKDLAGGRKERTELPTSKEESKFVDEGATGVDDIPEEAAFPVKGCDYGLDDGHVVIAAITSCTNTSNPNVLIAPACSPARRGPRA